MNDADDNTLSIETDDLKVEIRGSERAVSRAYSCLRELLFDLEGKSHADPPPEEALEGDTTPMYRVAPGPEAEGGGTAEDVGEDELSAAVRTGAADDEADEPSAFIQLILRRARYHKVHLLDPREVADSFLGRSMDTRHIRRIYTDTRTEERLRDRIEFGETLWRELTERGRAEVEGRHGSRAATGIEEETDAD